MTVAMTPNTKDLAVYIHWPYCVSKCPYCDFNSHVAATIDHDAFRTAYRRELEHYARLMPERRITSIFFGGGTPSLMQPQTVQIVIDGVAELWPLDPNIEITMEANPSSAEANNFAAFHQAGVRRLSLGVQSLRDDDLKFLGRAHGVDEAKRAIELAAKTFPRFSFDLIYARKEQTLDAWEVELREALTLAGHHLSLYQLTIEPATQFYTLAQRGVTLTAPEEDAAAMYERTQEMMAAAGLPAYEISNHARAGEESRHNMTYWHYRDYIGVGPGAHGRYEVNGTRYGTDNHRAPEAWLRHAESAGHGAKNVDVIDNDTAMREAVMMGLRLTEGMTTAEWDAKFSTALDVFLPPAKTKRLEDEGFMIRQKETLRATAAGLQRLNAVLAYLLA